MIALSAHSWSLIYSLLLGFAVAGLLVTGFRALTARPPGFNLLQAGGSTAILAVPFLAFAAPAIIIRNTVRGRLIENRRLIFVFAAALIAATWSLMSGRVLTMVIATLAF